MPARSVADPAGVAAGLRAAIDRSLHDPDLVRFDEPVAGGPLWAMGNNFKASFDREGWSFIARPLPGAPRAEPIRFRLQGARVGDTAIALVAAAPQRQARRVSFARGGLVETVDVRGDGVEQSFTFAELPARGELVLTLAVGTALDGAVDADGIVFADPFRRVACTQAVAVDATGARVPAAMAFAGGRLEIRVPGDFVARAQLPLVVDPIVASTWVRNDSNDLGEPDIAWGEEQHVWAVSFQRLFAVGDWDCFLQLLDANLTPVGGLVTVDFTSDAWQRPRIAYTPTVAAPFDYHGDFLVVAEVRTGTAPVKISGRVLHDTGVPTTGQFDVARSAVDEIHPAVGGQTALTAPPQPFYVVWESCFSAADHDIIARAVDPNGTVRFPIVVAADNLFQSHPAISKSSGSHDFANAASAGFALVYQQTSSAGDEDIHGALLDANGVIRPVGGQNTFAIDTSPHNDVLPQVSTFSDLVSTISSRHCLVAYERTDVNSGDIVATGLDRTGTVLASGNVTALEGDPVRLGWPQHAPSVDCDGTRFAVAYHELYNNNPTVNDLDTRVSLVGLGIGGLVVEEPGVVLAYTGNREFNVRIAAQHSGSGFPSPRFGAANDRDNAVSGFGIDAQAYDGMPSLGFQTRPTGCGALALAPAGQTTLGGTVSYRLGGSVAPLTGFLLGFPAANPIGACAGCTIGVDGNVIMGASTTLSLSTDPVWIGLAIAVQGFAFDTSGPCLGALSLTATVDFTVQ